MKAAMRIQQSNRGGCVVLTMAGRLDLAAAWQVQRTILKQLAGHPPAIICDLAQVEAIDPLCAGVFSSIRHPALGWPGTALLLCAARPAVAEVLAQLGVARHLAVYPSLDQALAHAHERPPRLREVLALGPVLTAAGVARAFTRQVCVRWGLPELAEPAALLAGELVTNAVVHARTDMELRLELHGTRLHLAVKDQDPNLIQLRAPEERAERGWGLVILDELATAWGVRRDRSGGKVAWCALALPARRAGPAEGRQLPARTHSAARAVAAATAGHRPAAPLGRPGPDLVRSKLVAPAPRAGLIARAGLQSLLQASLEARLCLVAAPAGSGKTTLLAQWRADAGAGRVAWVSLDEGDNDPTRFWVYVVEALRTVEPGVGGAALEALRGRSAELDRLVLPSLLNDLRGVEAPMVLVLDDYHLVTEARCHQTLGFFLDRLPALVHVVLATRADPPLPLARMRVRGELAELRMADLQFTGDEAAVLLNEAMGLALAAEDVARLAERTEGWAAGLYLAGLSIRGRQDASAFIASFHGDNRSVADYLATEVLERQPTHIRRFLLRSSVLERLSGPLCDAVLEAEGSAELLEELERSNLFLVPLDDHRRWYRYQHLFAQLLRQELGSREAALVPVLHRRAAAWHQAAGQAGQAIGHATAAGEFAQAGALIVQHWVRERRATVARWLRALPEEAILADPSLAFVAAWTDGFSGAPKQQVDRWLAAVEDPAWDGALPDGISSLAFGAALTGAVLVFDDVGRAVRAARRALELAGTRPSRSRWMAQAALGQALYLCGQPAQARPPLEEVVQLAPAAQPHAFVTALAILSLLAGVGDDEQTATVLARRAAEVAEAHRLGAEPVSGIVHLALGRALALQGRLAEAETELGWALDRFRIESMAIFRAPALLLLASVQRDHGDLPGARSLLHQARALIEGLADPGAMPALLEQAQQELDRAQPVGPQLITPLTERELAVLRQLPTRLSAAEIGRELSVSVNTIRSQVQAIYRKLQVSTRADAVDHARRLGLLTGAPPGP
jgi:LuxR family transcriptional regulator, maltose regulon positive regulatory protein